MKQYLDLLQHILDKGRFKGDRTGTGTYSVFGYQMRMDLNEGFPLLTTKKMFLKGILHELLWFLSGDTNIKPLVDNGVNIWVPDAYREYVKKMKHRHVPEEIILTEEEFKHAIKQAPHFAQQHGELGPVYGKQWRRWNVYDYKEGGHGGYYEWRTIDQMAQIIEQIKSNPDSRRLLVTAWNPAEIKEMALPPCHYAFQFYVLDNTLSCMFNMRSTDIFLGLPFNIASYALLTMMVAQVCDLKLGELIYTGADNHIYTNHMDQVKLQLTREPFPLPKIIINPDVKNIFDFKYDDFKLEDYQSHASIKGEVST